MPDALEFLRFMVLLQMTTTIFIAVVVVFSGDKGLPVDGLSLCPCLV